MYQYTNLYNGDNSNIQTHIYAPIAYEYVLRMSLHQVHILQIRCRCRDVAELTIPLTNDLSELVILFLKMKQICSTLEKILK